MGGLLSYSLMASLFLLLLYPVMQQLVARSTNFRFNRYSLLAGMGLSLLLPLMGILCGGVFKTVITSDHTAAMTQTLIGNISGETEKSTPEGHPYMAIAVGVYALGVIALALREVFSFIRLFIIINRAEKINEGKYTICLLKDKEIAPFSWKRYIFLNEYSGNIETDGIFIHEKSHVEYRHWVDVLFSDIFCILLWYHPFAWKLRHLVKLNHEFQADSNVIESGIEPYVYQRLILETAMDRTMLGIANCFGSNKKGFRKRVLAIGRTPSSRKTLLLSLYALPAAIVGIMLISFSASSHFLGEVASTSLITQFTLRENGDEETSSYAGEDRAMAEFEGGLSDLYDFLGENTKYPEVADEEVNVKHKVVVCFDVDEKGDVGNVHVKKSTGDVYEKESIRVITLTSGKWKPAVKDGRPVKSSLSLPFYFTIKE